jgi:hypothetical protein
MMMRARTGRGVVARPGKGPRTAPVPKFPFLQIDVLKWPIGKVRSAWVGMGV